MCFLSFLILVICDTFSLIFSISLAKGFSIVVILFKEPTFSFISLLYVFVSFFISIISIILSVICFLLFTFRVLCFLFFKVDV